MVGPEGESVHRWSLSFVADAWFGREGRVLVPDQLRSFYAQSYLQRNPDMDASDAPYKADLLTEVWGMRQHARPRSVLEIGCGSGALLAEMKRRLQPTFVTGVDYSHDIAASGQARYGHQVGLADGAALPFKDGAFDLVYFADVLEHVLDPIAFLREAARVGKTIAFLIPVEAGWLTTPLYVYRRLRKKHTNYEQYGHIWRWNRRQIAAFLQSAGIELDTYKCFQAPPKFEGMNRLGRLVETARIQTGMASQHLAEVLFGTGALIGVGRRRSVAG